ncbi:hypothetical protein [Chitinophaga sancti]|uniref:Uncharacterized protein n=1 Tax=Chitinophaga sancti TaxID=1004 RepID=A0A1K1RA01_9BACT|nr:hypothetical protein [Chitinophaga sancti]WQD65530.1 hypothetical protein U0033_14110 [Chitinophaga sancti]WQG88847.1 hypothetical protein SR876_28360 [Chitinophaga sancti]SFW68967.1 hypothetical protein SAMN05661012_03535 [Chitinophaga sancti]
MKQSIQQKIEQYKAIARNQGSNHKSVLSKSVRIDGLAQVIRSQKDAEIFMAELKSVIKRAQ